MAFFLLTITTKRRIIKLQKQQNDLFLKTTERSGHRGETAKAEKTAEKKRQSRPNNQNDHLDYRHPTVDKNHHWFDAWHYQLKKTESKPDGTNIRQGFGNSITQIPHGVNLLERREVNTWKLWKSFWMLSACCAASAFWAACCGWFGRNNFPENSKNEAKHSRHASFSPQKKNCKLLLLALLCLRKCTACYRLRGFAISSVTKNLWSLRSNRLARLLGVCHCITSFRERWYW